MCSNYGVPPSIPQRPQDLGGFSPYGKGGPGGPGHGPGKGVSIFDGPVHHPGARGMEPQHRHHHHHNDIDDGAFNRGGYQQPQERSFFSTGLGKALAFIGGGVAGGFLMSLILKKPAADPAAGGAVTQPPPSDAGMPSNVANLRNNNFINPDLSKLGTSVPMQSPSEMAALKVAEEAKKAAEAAKAAGSGGTAALGTSTPDAGSAGNNDPAAGFAKAKGLIQGAGDLAGKVGDLAGAKPAGGTPPSGGASKGGFKGGTVELHEGSTLSQIIKDNYPGIEMYGKQYKKIEAEIVNMNPKLAQDKDHISKKGTLILPPSD